MGHPHLVPVGGTQSFVHTLSACWRRPSLTGLEVLWRWVYGVPALAAIGFEALGVLRGTPLDFAALRRMTVLDPMAAEATLAQAVGVLLLPILHVARWLAPLLFVAWIAMSALGRTAVLRRADLRLHGRPVTLMWLHGLRTAALLGVFAIWFGCLRVAGGWAVSGPIAAGQEPNLVLYCAVVIVATLVLFTLWAVLNWPLTVAPLLAMLLDLGAGASLAAALRLGPVRSKLVEINMVMGIVKIALIVLAMVFSATPLPFESVATPEFMEWWYAGVMVLYFVASDFFHVARLVAYLRLWRAYEGPDDLSGAPFGIVHLTK